MPVIKATLCFESGLYGWTEAYYKPSGTTLNQACNDAATLALTRAAMCGYGVKIPYIKASVEGVRGDSAISARTIWITGPFYLPPADADPNSFITVQPAVSSPADQPYSAVMCRQESVATIGINPVPQKFRNVYLRGLPDAQIRNPPPFVQTNAWKLAFEAWAEECKKWSFRAVNRIIDPVGDPITSWVLNLTFIRIVAPTKIFVPGTIVTISGAKPLLRPWRPNRLYLVTATSAPDTADLVALDGKPVSYPAGAAAMGGRVQGVLSEVVYPAIAFSSIQTETHRNTGRPFRSPRGRQSARR